MRDEARKTLGRKEIEYLIGYRQGSYGFRISAAFITNKEDADLLTFSPLCALSLVNYLTIEGKPPLTPAEQKAKPGKIALVVRGCDSRALNQILAEGGLSRDRLYIIGVPCSGVVDLRKLESRFPGVIDPAEVSEENGNYLIRIKDQTHTVPKGELLADTCKVCRYPTPLIFDKLVGDKTPGNPARYDDIQSLEAKTAEEKREFWRGHLSRCLRCYACKNSCPLCYCDGCVLDNLKPQWVKRSVDTSENFMFHLTRAFHLAGRCISCGECERACPVSIPLMKFNRKMEKDVKEIFNFEAGKDPAAQPLLNTLIDGLCPVHQRTPEWIKERNYFFRLSAYRDRLLAHYRDVPDFVAPESRRNEMLRLLEAGLEDISVSRAGQAWGIPLPFAPANVVYVWYDALVNYAAAVGYGTDDELFRTWWPAALHLVGKDITRFHCVVWPAMLMSAGLALPGQVFGHGWVLTKGQKMSKSQGTVLDPLDAADRFGPDPLRLYLMKEIVFGPDGDFTWDRFEEKYNVDLANNLGNLS